MCARLCLCIQNCPRLWFVDVPLRRVCEILTGTPTLASGRTLWTTSCSWLRRCNSMICGTLYGASRRAVYSQGAVAAIFGEPVLVLRRHFAAALATTDTVSFVRHFSCLQALDNQKIQIICSNARMYNVLVRRSTFTRQSYQTCQNPFVIRFLSYIMLGLLKCEVNYLTSWGIHLRYCGASMCLENSSCISFCLWGTDVFVCFISAYGIDMLIVKYMYLYVLK